MTAPQNQAEIAQKMADLSGKIAEMLPEMQDGLREMKSRSAEFDKINAETQAALKEFNQLSNRLTTLEQKSATMDGVDTDEPKAETKSIGQKFAEKFAEKGSGKEKIIVSQKELTITTAGGWFVEYNTGEFIKPPRRDYSFLDLINWATVPVNTNSVAMNKEENRTNNAAFVAAGAAKPVSEIVYGKQDVDLKTLATLLYMQRQVFKAGGERLRTEIDTTLYDFLREALEAQILGGDGTGENLNGILNQATAFENKAPLVTEYGMLDKLLLGSLQLAATGYRPDAFVLSPFDYVAIRLLKNDIGGYLIPQSVNGEQVREFWEVPVFTTLAMPQGTWLVGDFARTARGFRDEDGVEIGYYEQDLDNVRKNMITVRAEERLGFGVTATAAYVKGDYETVSGGGGNNP